MNQDNTPQIELCNRYEKLYTGAITDTLDEIGFEEQTLDPDIVPLSPGMTISGTAFPIRGRPNRTVDPEENIRAILRMLSDAPEGSVLIYETNDDTSAHIGELTTTSLRANNCRGAVVDGGARDVSFIRDQEFPVFRRYDTPADCVYRWEILEWGAGAVVGGVEVNPNDIVVGDSDGVVVIPADVAEEILESAEARVNSENQVRTKVREGVRPIDAYDEHGAF